ncbi:CatA-like O-acetyltransferase [Hoeflea olei]|uniref:Chloramphenicol acetyltransferase n=1 Tax=Hoeflea olei TaxID=1480615 RepID=A0A1C1YZX5_9HYPH|nr:CatA-like O-acetyltransferase [Hoeflea olei]OCW58946.1 chloramphenicol acetyltransferase [Hoeflea olei]
MAGAREIDLDTWSRAGQYRLFRGYDRPHFATTARIDVTALMTQAKPAGVSPYRAFMHAIGTGIHAVPEFRMRFLRSGTGAETVVEYDAIALSATVPRAGDTFGYAYIPFSADWATFDAACKAVIEETARGTDLGANTGERVDLAYLSCLPWIDFTALDNALPGPDDCIPRFSWGKFVGDGQGRISCAMAVQVHHALIDGLQVGRLFEAVQARLDQFRGFSDAA